MRRRHRLEECIEKTSFTLALQQLKNVAEALHAESSNASDRYVSKEPVLNHMTPEWHL